MNPAAPGPALVLALAAAPEPREKKKICWGTAEGSPDAVSVSLPGQSTRRGQLRTPSPHPAPVASPALLSDTPDGTQASSR